MEEKPKPVAAVKTTQTKKAVSHKKKAVSHKKKAGSHEVKKADHKGKTANKSLGEAAGVGGAR